MAERTRTQGGLQTIVGSTTQFYKNATSVVSAQNGGKKGTYGSMTDFVSERFGERRDRGEIINTPMTSELTTIVNNPSTTSWVWSPLSNVSNGGNYGFSSSDAIALRFPSQTQSFPLHRLPTYQQQQVWSADHRAIAITAAFANVASPESMALVTFGERRETGKMLQGAVDTLTRKTRPFARLRDLYNRGKLRPEKFLLEMESTWLGLRYGVMPLMYDIEGYTRAFTSVTRRERATARGKYNTSGTVTWQDVATSALVNTIQLNWSLDWQIKYRAGVIYARDVEMQGKLGLNLWDIPTAAWELVTLSFVADWFANTGDYLAAQTARSRAELLGSWATVDLTAIATATYFEAGSKTSGSLTSQSQSNASGATWICAYRGRRRDPVTISDVEWGMRLALSPKRLIDGFSLLHQALSPKLRR